MSKTISEVTSILRKRQAYVITEGVDPYAIRNKAMDDVRKADDKVEVLMKWAMAEKHRIAIKAITSIQSKLVSVLTELDNLIFQKYEALEEKEGSVNPDTVHRFGVAEPKPNLGVPRSKMPQIDPQFNDEFIKYVKDKGNANAHTVSVRVGDLNATQNEINLRKVAAIMKKVPVQSLTKVPILFSRDKYVLDGHHRWASLRLKDPNLKIPGIQFDLPMRELLKLALSFPKVYKAGVKERKLAEKWVWDMMVCCAIQEALLNGADESLVESIDRSDVLGFIKEVSSFRAMSGLPGISASDKKRYVSPTDSSWIAPPKYGDFDHQVFNYGKWWVAKNANGSIDRWKVYAYGKNHIDVGAIGSTPEEAIWKTVDRVGDDLQ